MFYDWDWAGAEQEIHRGLAFDPHFAELHNLYSHLLAYRGRFDESIAEARRAEELDPLGEYNSVQRALKFSRRYDLFLSEMERTFANNPVRIHENKAWVHRARKEYAQEVQETDQQLRLQGRVRYADLLARAYASGGYRAWLEAQLVELKQQSEKRRVSPFEFAEAYAALRDADKTMHYLELGYQERTADMVRIQVNPAYDDLHLDPRYRDLVRRVGLPQ
jgi:tetratricopeptide (TPR) repeat protein